MSIAIDRLAADLAARHARGADLAASYTAHVAAGRHRAAVDVVRALASLYSISTADALGALSDHGAA